MKAVTRKFQAQLDAVERARAKAVAKLAAEARKEILPEFQKRGWRLVSGNGMWFITGPDGEGDIRDEALPDAIRELLYLEIDQDTCLAHYIKEIK